MPPELDFWGLLREGDVAPPLCLLGTRESYQEAERALQGKRPGQGRWLCFHLPDWLLAHHVAGESGGKRRVGGGGQGRREGVSVLQWEEFSLLCGPAPAPAVHVFWKLIQLDEPFWNCQVFPGPERRLGWQGWGGRKDAGRQQGELGVSSEPGTSGVPCLVTQFAYPFRGDSHSLFSLLCFSAGRIDRIMGHCWLPFAMGIFLCILTQMSSRGWQGWVQALWVPGLGAALELNRD